MQRIEQFVSILNRRHDEARIAAFTLAWGVWLLLPFRTFTSVTAAYVEMEKVGSETAWGLAVVTIGLLKLWGILTGGRWRRLLFGCLAGALWTSVAVLFYLSSPASTGVPVYGVLAISAIWTAFHITNGK